MAIELPYVGEVEANTTYGRRCLLDSLRRGEAPFASHLLYTQSGVLDDRDHHDRVLGLQAGFAWARSADHVAVYLDRGITGGMQAGLVLHLQRRKRVVLRSIGDGAGSAVEVEWTREGETLSCVCSGGEELCKGHVHLLGRFPLSIEGFRRKAKAAR